MAEYGSMFLVSGLASILFLGGWNGPIPLATMLGLSYPPGATEFSLAGYLGNFLGMLNFMFKASLGVTVMMWIRWTLPRLRIDQVIKTCLKYCLPLAAICFLGALTWTILLPGRAFFGALPFSRPLGAVRELPVGIAATQPADDRASRPPAEPIAGTGEDRALRHVALDVPGRGGF